MLGEPRLPVSQPHPAVTHQPPPASQSWEGTQASCFLPLFPSSTPELRHPGSLCSNSPAVTLQTENPGFWASISPCSPPPSSLHCPTREPRCPGFQTSESRTPHPKVGRNSGIWGLTRGLRWGPWSTEGRSWVGPRGAGGLLWGVLSVGGEWGSNGAWRQLPGEVGGGREFTCVCNGVHVGV